MSSEKVFRSAVGELRKRNCGGCYFSRVVGEARQCLRESPAVDEKTGLARWPIVQEGDVCGQFRYPGAEHLPKDDWPRNSVPIYRDEFGDYCKIPIGQGRFAKADPEDYIWLSQFRWRIKLNKNAAYAFRSLTRNGKTRRIYMHRELMKTPAQLVCDHINHNGLDNRKSNLRNCTGNENRRNRRAVKNASSKYKGVHYHKLHRRFSASIKHNGRQRHLGHFSDEKAAARAYDEKAAELFGEFAHLNFRGKCVNG